jgi:hypothetical protein
MLLLQEKHTKSAISFFLIECSENSGPDERIEIEAVDRGLIQDQIQFILPQSNRPSTGTYLNTKVHNLILIVLCLDVPLLLQKITPNELLPRYMVVPELP